MLSVHLTKTGLTLHSERNSRNMKQKERGHSCSGRLGTVRQSQMPVWLLWDAFSPHWSGKTYMFLKGRIRNAYICWVAPQKVTAEAMSLNSVWCSRWMAQVLGPKWSNQNLFLWYLYEMLAWEASLIWMKTSYWTMLSFFIKESLRGVLVLISAVVSLELLGKVTQWFLSRTCQAAAKEIHGQWNWKIGLFQYKNVFEICAEEKSSKNHWKIFWKKNGMNFRFFAWMCNFSFLWTFGSNLL